MTRLCLTVEGFTEQEFALTLLRPHLAGIENPVQLNKPRLASLGKRKQRVHRGGVVSYEAVKNDICRWLKEDDNPDVRFSTMFDLYGLPSGFPGHAEAAEKATAGQRVAALEEAFEKDINDSRFIAYIQLHEFEALLLAEPSAFGPYFRDSEPAIEKAIERIAAFCERYDTPELIDDGVQTAPSKRIIAEIPQYKSAKRTAGPIVAAEIGLDTMRKKCPHFNEWLSRLEQLGIDLEQ